MSENELSNNVPELKKLIISQYNEIQELKDKINLLQKKQFAPKSEAKSSEDLGLFNEAEELDKDNQVDAEDDKEEEANEEQPDEQKKKKKKKRRTRLPDHLPRQEIIIDLEDKDKKIGRAHV